MNSYVGYIQINDGDDINELVDTMKNYVCELLLAEDPEITKGCINDISNLKITEDDIKGDYIEIQLPASFSGLIIAANTIGMNPLGMLTESKKIEEKNV